MNSDNDRIFRQIWKMQNEMERLLRDFFASKNPLLMMAEDLWRPPTDVFETEFDFVVKMEIAGVRQEDIKITLSGDTLTVRGRREDTFPPGKRNFRQMEINHGAFERVIFITGPIDEKNIKASCQDGFLEITLPKTRQIESKSIDIEPT